MREIIQLHVGQAGIQIGNTAWELLCLEHGIQPDGSSTSNQNLQVLFSESYNKLNVPRAAFFDNDQVSINSMMKGPLKKIFNKNLINLSKNEASTAIWGSKKIDSDAEDIIRKLLESADAASAIIIYHSMAGEYGSAFTCKLLQLLNDETAKTTKLTMSIFPSSKKLSQFGQPIIEPYNTLLALPTLAEMSDFNILYDNAALYRVCEQQFQQDSPSFNHINYMIAQTISSITQSIRFRGSKFVDFNDMRNNLIPKPKQQFLWTSYAPFISVEQQNLKKLNLQEITESLFDEKGPLLSFNRLTHKYLAASLFFKGDCPMPELNYVMKQIKQSEEIRFTEGTQVQFQTSVSSAQPQTLPNYQFGKHNKVACMLAHSTGVLDGFKALLNRFNSILGKKAFLHWFTQYGLEEGKFNEQKEALQSILDMYQENHGDGQPIQVQPKSDRKQDYGYKPQQQQQQQPKRQVQIKQKQESAPKKTNQITTAKADNRNEDNDDSAFQDRAPVKRNVQQQPQTISTDNKKQSITTKPNRIQQQENIEQQPEQQDNIQIELNEQQQQQQQDNNGLQSYGEPQQQNDGFLQTRQQQDQQNNQDNQELDELSVHDNDDEQ